MSKKIFATLLAALFILSIALVAVPTQAHHTLGRLTNNPSSATPYRLRDFDTHVPGPIGYVWPGGGYGSYVGPSSMGPISQGMPGYQSPWSPNPPGASLDWYQLRGNAYAPFGAILTGAKGDLIIAINFTKQNIGQGTLKDYYAYDDVIIYVPPEFKPPVDWASYDTSNIIASWDNRYFDYGVVKADVKDAFGPGWWVIQIWSTINFTKEHNYGEWYYIRLNGMTAPEIAGRYFFKIFLNESWPIVNSVNEEGDITPVTSTMPVENWPVLLVKGEVDPGIIEGTVLYGAWNTTLYNQPLQVSGRVRAVGVTPEGRHVEARGYFNASAKGHFEIEGVAPGTYTIYASAAGYPEQKVAEGIKVREAQSLRLDIYLNPGSQISGIIFSKTISGLTPWRSQLPISIAIYNSDNYSELNVECSSPLNLTHAPYTSYVVGNVIFDSATGLLASPNKPKLVAFPWEGPISYYSYTSSYPFNDPFGVFNGVGPAQVWWVDPKGNLDPVTNLGSGSDFFKFQFGQKGFYGVPAKLSGMIPQVFATWIDGLKPGTYFIRAFINGYIQSDASGIFKDVYFYINDASNDIFIQIDVYASSFVNVTVHFHSSPGTIIDEAVGGPDPGRFLIAEVLSEDGSLAAFNFTYILSSCSQASILLNGLGMVGVMPFFDPRAGVKYSLFKYRGLRDYGLHPGSYIIRLYMRGYIQANPPALNLEDLDQPLRFSISLGGNAYLSTHMFRGGGLNVTATSTDWQKPSIIRQWAWNKAPLTILVYDLASKTFSDAIYFWDSINYAWRVPITNSMFSTVPWPDWRSVFGSKASMLVTNGSTILERIGPDLPLRFSTSPDKTLITNVFLQQLAHIGFLYSSLTYRDLNFKSTIAFYPGFYAVTCWSYGYVQEAVRSLGDLGKEIVYVKMGSLSDLNIKLIKGVEFNITIIFRKEGVLTTLPYNMSMRIRIYDENDMLVAAASTSLDAGAALQSNDAGFFADGKKIGLSGGAAPPIPAGTRIVEYKRLAGLFSYSDPSLTEALRRLTRFSTDHGVWGSSINVLDGAYNGNWKIIVELVNWYYYSTFYPPPPALLQGETHLTNLTFLLPYNHLGPFELKEPLITPNAMLGEEKSIVLGLDQRGYLNGLVMFLNVYNEARVASWASIIAKTEKDIYAIYSWDGRYEMYLPAGFYIVTVEEEELKTETLNINVSEGAEVSCDFLLKPGEINIPEFSYPVKLNVLAISIASAFFFIKRKTLKLPF